MLEDVLSGDAVAERGKARGILQKYCIDALPVLNKRGIITDIIFAHGLDVDNRKQVDIPVVMMAGGLVLEPSSYTVTMNNQPINLTKKEFDLLKYLMSHKGEAVTRDALLTDVWGYDYAGDTNVVDVYIRYLRHKIDEPFGVKTLHTIRAVGYMFRVDD